MTAIGQSGKVGSTFTGATSGSGASSTGTTISSQAPAAKRPTTPAGGPGDQVEHAPANGSSCSSGGFAKGGPAAPAPSAGNGVGLRSRQF